MHKLLLLPVLLLLSAQVIAQTALTGTVTDGRKRPIAGASITLKDTYDGATTDSLGRFSFTTEEKGAAVLLASATGYKKGSQAITLIGRPLRLSFELKEAVNELTAVIITAGAFEASDRKRTTVLNSIDIVTTASANADITGAIRTLPGAQQVGESEGLFVRGGTAAETRVFIDGTPVNNFFYSSVPNIAQRGRFSPMIFKGTVFSSGGYSALYGGALSSALILESIDLPERSSASLGISVLGASGGFQQLSKSRKSSWGANYGYTHLGPAFAVIRQQPDFFQVPVFHTADANYRLRTKGGMVKYYGYYSANKLGVRTPSLDTLGYQDAFSLKNGNHYHNLSWRESLGNRWKVQTGFSYNRNRDRIAGALQDEGGETKTVNAFEWKNFGLDSRGTLAHLRAVVEKGLSGLSALRFGAEWGRSTDQPLYRMHDGTTYGGGLKEDAAALFAEGDIFLTNNLAAKVGGRAERSTLLDRYNFAPRLSLAYKTGPQSQASLAYGQFYQAPESRYLTPSSGLGYTKATHYIAQYQKVSTGRTFRAEAFYKHYDRLLKTALAGGREQGVSTNGNGYAKGVEIFLRDKKTFKGVDYWVSYSYLDTERDFLNYPFRLQPSFAARHTASLVLKKFISPWSLQVNGAYNWASSRPYYFIGADGSGAPKLQDAGLTPDYHNFSLSFNYLPGIQRPNNKNFVVYVLSVSNVFGFDQQFGYKYSANGRRREAIVPPSKSFIFLGAFFSFGVDRSQDVINSNL